jgi:plasmid stabilization system protein ParE
MKVLIGPEAEEDIFASYRWYQGCEVGLGEEFLRAIDACIALIQRNPLSYSIVRKNIRRALIRRFPHSIFYIVDEDTIVVLACFHVRQDPKKLKDRK